MKYIPNILTIARMVSAPILFFLIIQEQFLYALILASVLSISDALDGFLSKHFSWSSRFGELADPIADKIMLSGSFVTLGLVGIIPLWLMALLVGRDILIVTGVIGLQWRLGSIPMSPTKLSKLNTFLQLFLLLWILLNELTPLSTLVTAFLTYTVATLIVLTASEYIIIGIRHLRMRRQQ